MSVLEAQLKVVNNKNSEGLSEVHNFTPHLDYKMASLTSPQSDLPKPGKDLSSTGPDYDRIKAECDRMNAELKSQEQKYDQMVETSNKYRQQLKVTRDKLEQANGGLAVMRSQNSEILEDKRRLEDEVSQQTRLREEDRSELRELRAQQRQVMSESGCFDGFSALYDQAVNRHESLKQDYDSVRKQYADTVASLNTTSSKLELLQEQYDRLQKQYELVVQEKNSAQTDRNILQQHVTSAIQSANREKNDILKELKEIKRECDLSRKKVAHYETQNLQVSKDVSRLRKERDAVVHEYTLVMSERDSVHKEMEQLQDKLSAYEKRLELKDKEKLSKKDETESLQRELAVVTEQKDRALRQLNELKDKYGERRLDPKDFDRLTPERRSGQRDQKELLERRELENKELESLRKEVERLQSELTDLLQEKDECKRRCDWAISERDTVVRERESIRTLCDSLRHERDDRVSKLIEALRDTDELKKQKSDVVRELKELREKYETVLEKEARKGQLHAIGHNHSHDSAIDADLQEWETETLQLEIGGASLSDLGIDLLCGRSDPQIPENTVFVANVRSDSCASGKVKVNDQLLTVNSMEVSNLEKSAIYQAMCSSGNTLQMIVRRRKMVSTRPILPVHVNLSEGDLGLQLEMGLYICRIVPGSASAKEGSLAIGDRILSVNGCSVENLSPAEVMRIAQSQGDHVLINIIKYSITPSSSALLSSSPSSGHNLTESSPDGLSLSPRSPPLHRRSWTSPSPDNKTSLSLKCNGSQTDSLDSPQPSVHGWSDQEKTHREYNSTRPINIDYAAKKDLKTDGEYSKRLSQNLDFDKSVHPEYLDSSHRYRSHDKDSYERSHDHLDSRRSHNLLDQKVQRRYPDYPEQRLSKDSLIHKKSYEILEHHQPIQKRSHDQYEQKRSHDQLNHKWSHDQPNPMRSHDQTGSVRSHDQIGSLRSHDQPDHRGSHDTDKRRLYDPRMHKDMDKTTFSDKAMSRSQKQSHSTDRATRDARCKSVHPSFKLSEQTTEEDVIKELNEVITQYENPPRITERRREKPQNGGTWPKCRGHVEYPNAKWMPPVTHKERPPLPNSLGSHQDGRMPPTPPERNDSFKRSASIKHSPQNSESTTKFKNHYPPVSQTKATSLQSYHTSPTQPLMSGSPPSDTNSGETQQSHGDVSWRSSNSPAGTTHYETTTNSASLYSSPDSSQNDSLDFSVKSANDQNDIKRYVRHPPGRPSSASSKKKAAQAQAKAEERRNNRPQASHSKPGDYPVHKPQSLDIQPIYSPRPLPHSSRNITPSHPYPPSYTPTGSSKHPLFPGTGSGSSLASRDKALTPGQGKTISSYPTSVPAQTQVLRSPLATFQVATSQLVSPQGSGTPSPIPSQIFPRYNSPTNHYTKGSSGSSVFGSSIPETEGENCGVYRVVDRCSATPSPSPSQQSSNITTSDDFPYDFVHQRSVQGRHSAVHGEGTSSTFPKRVGHYPDRIRIPSNPSIIAHRSHASSSIERVSDHNSPVSPPYGALDYLPAGTSHSLPKTVANNKKRLRLPREGETRDIKVEKSIEPLGIQIQCGSEGGIFVSSVSNNSLASRNGITVGDQLLEVCGINMRNATKDAAASVLRQCAGDINMLVQYKPSQYQEEVGMSGPSTESSEANTPEISQNRKEGPHRVSDETLTSDTPHAISPIHSVKTTDTYPPVEPRFVILKKASAHETLGITLVGGNSVGIFVRTVQPNSVSGGLKGLRYGDQLLEYNGINFRSVTHEQAVVEISKSAETVSILAQYNVQRLNKILEQPGDSMYIRALFDHQADNEGELSFSKNEILFVDNTMYNGKMGLWRAWKVDDIGNKLQCGTIPSKSRLEEELSLKRSQSEMGEDELCMNSRRGSASARRSFFRKKKHQRSNSRDSRELNSFSDASINSDSVPFLDDGSVLTFERVERLDSNVCRPVLILAPLAEPLTNKLTSESPDKYCRCETEFIKASISSMETGQNEGLFVDFKTRPDGQFECITVQSVKDIISKNRHCLMNVHPDAIEHLHKVNIYPIVLFVKHKTSKEIRDVKDTRFLPEKLSNKIAKELFETFQGHEKKYKRLFSDIIPGGNLAVMFRTIKAAIDTEQKKTLWVPSGYL